MMTKMPIIVLVFLLLAGCTQPAHQAALGSVSQDPNVDPPPTQIPTQTPTQAAVLDPIDPPATPTPGGMTPVVMTDLVFPIRAAYYFPWYLKAWNESTLNVFDRYPTFQSFYSQEDKVAIIKQQIAAMQYGKIQAGIISFWEKGNYADAWVPALLHAGEATGFHWTVYASSENDGNPPVVSIRADLEFIKSHYASSPAYLKIDGRFVVFVYSSPTDGCDMVNRWEQADTVGAYLVMRIFPGRQYCDKQPDAWHQYTPATADFSVGKDSFSISPGYWQLDETQPRLARDLASWNADIRAMIKSNADFQLISTFNEWNQGTSVENDQGWQSPSGYGLYLDALHNNGQPVSNTSSGLNQVP